MNGRSEHEINTWEVFFTKGVIPRLNKQLLMKDMNSKPSNTKEMHNPKSDKGLTKQTIRKQKQTYI